MSHMRWTAIWLCHLKCHVVCLSVILLCYRVICLQFCNKKGALFVPGPCIVHLMRKSTFLFWQEDPYSIFLANKRWYKFVNIAEFIIESDVNDGMQGLWVLTYCTVENPSITTVSPLHTSIPSCRANVWTVWVTWKKSTNKWTCTIQTYVVQGWTVFTSLAICSLSFLWARPWIIDFALG